MYSTQDFAWIDRFVARVVVISVGAIFLAGFTAGVVITSAFSY